MSDTIQRMTDAVPTWGVRLSYGDKQTVGDIEFVPVAVVSFGFGAGDFSDDAAPGAPTRGGGGGGGGMAVPVGAYVGDRDGFRFQPNPVALLVALAPVVAAAGWAISRIARALR
jgi:uncharacterized spore protein YtfJ